MIDEFPYGSENSIAFKVDTSFLTLSRNFRDQKTYEEDVVRINLIDPNLFTQFIELIKAKDKNRYLKKYKKNNNDLLKTRLKDSFTYNKGENLINNPKSFQSASTLDWFLSENLKYNATAEKELSISEMYDEFIKHKNDNTLTTHQKYFIQQYDKKEDGIDIYFDTLLKSCSDDKDKKTTFSKNYCIYYTKKYVSLRFLTVFKNYSS